MVRTETHTNTTPAERPPIRAHGRLALPTLKGSPPRAARVLRAAANGQGGTR